jgi:hypothetical protein
VECEDRTSDECAAEGGLVVMATSCDPNPEVITADRCTARSGTPSTVTSCDPDPCATAGPEEIVYCVPHPDNPGEASEWGIVTSGECTARSGTPSTATSCNPNPCAA